MSKVFITHSRAVFGQRLDPEYHYALASISLKSPYPSVKLLSLAYFKTGGTPSTSVDAYWNGALPWISAKDFTAFRFDDSEDHITELAAKEATTYVVDKPALLMVSRSGILQHSLPVMVTYKRAAINQDIKAFFPDSRVSVDYLGAYFDLLGKRLLPLLCKSGATVQSINTNELMNLQVPVPPPDVQRRLVAELDAAYAAKRKADEKAAELLASIDDIVLDALGIPPIPPADTSLASRIFTVSSREVVDGRLDAYHYRPYFRKNVERLKCVGCVPLSDIVKLSHEMWDQKEWEDGTSVFPYLEIGAIDVEFGSVADIVSIPVEEAPSRARMIARQCDLLVSLTRPTRRAIAFVPMDYEKIVASTGFSIIRKVAPSIMPEYLSAVLRSEICTLQFDERSSGGNYPAITEDQLLQCIVPVPSKVVQEKIVATVTEIRAKAKRLKADAQSALVATKKCIESGVIGQKENKI